MADADDMLDQPRFCARRYQSGALARRAFDRVTERRQEGCYVTRAFVDDVPIVAAVAVTRHAARVIDRVGWGGEPYELSEDLRVQLLERIGHLYVSGVAHNTFVRRGNRAGVELQPGGAGRPQQRPQG